MGGAAPSNWDRVEDPVQAVATTGRSHGYADGGALGTKRARVPWRGRRPIGITAIGQTERLSSGQPEMGSGSNFESTTRSRQQPRLRALGKRGIQISRSRGLGLPIALGRRTVGLGLAIPSSQRWEEGHDIE